MTDIEKRIKGLEAECSRLRLVSFQFIMDKLDLRTAMRRAGLNPDAEIDKLFSDPEYVRLRDNA